MLTCDVNFAFKSKEGEEVCGDSIKIKRSEDKVVVTVSDGLGSGIKASILSTLTASMTTTMLFNDMPMDEVMKSVLATLPKCKVRDISYANFCSVLFKAKENTCYIAEYEFPVVLLFRKNEFIDFEKKRLLVEDREIKESYFVPQDGDLLFVMTDGVSQAGLGTRLYPLGLGIENIKREIFNLTRYKVPPKEIVNYLIEKAKRLDKGIKGDDALLCVLYFRSFNRLNIMVGPPSDPNLDEYVAYKFLNMPGRKVICGGTTAQIVGRIMGSEVSLDLKTVSEDSPPVGYMEGVDLVTEGIITLTQVFRYLDGQIEKVGYGASLIIDLIEKSDEICFIVGKAINPAYQNPLFSYDMSLKFKIVKDIMDILKNKGKIVKIEAY
ncbi:MULTISPECIES: SpoIIE family protein phosphatase [Dictyoglomus]|uniref:Protein serine/threonine phosphatase n=1 Tax=Dictyoglomus turgidum (strain DSM 6724 / Z-1310) TaxID=515635 RepID=B8DZB4_DICTD|nr:protein serine/threonine phosphatase [Dictyoglomus turgidum DSM 6724]HBU31298.1 stage II sporulation protein [Dictyoglomus sp.]